MIQRTRSDEDDPDNWWDPYEDAVQVGSAECLPDCPDINPNRAPHCGFCTGPFPRAPAELTPIERYINELKEYPPDP